MDVLGMFRLRGLEQKQSGHPELSHDIATGPFIHKFKDNALTESLGRLQTSASVPRHGGIPFSNDIRTANPYLFQPCPEKTSPDLSGNNFSFWKLRHTSSRLRTSEGAPLRHEDGRKARRG